MTNFVNSMTRRRPDGFAQRTAEIKRWTKTALRLDEDVVISVNELACGQPGCPPLQTVILILLELHPPRKMTIHKAIMDVSEEEVVLASAQLLE